MVPRAAVNDPQRFLRLFALGHQLIIEIDALHIPHIIHTVEMGVGHTQLLTLINKGAAF